MFLQPHIRPHWIKGRMKNRHLIYVGISNHWDSFHRAISRSDQMNSSFTFALRNLGLCSLELGGKYKRGDMFHMHIPFCFCAVRQIPTVDLALLLIIALYLVCYLCIMINEAWRMWVFTLERQDMFQWECPPFLVLNLHRDRKTLCLPYEYIRRIRLAKQWGYPGFIS